MKKIINFILLRTIYLYISIYGLLTFLFINVEASNDSSKRPFTVVDAVTMVELSVPNVEDGSYISSDFNISPDNRYFLIVTRQGNLASGLNDYRLILYKTESVIDFINNKDKDISSIGTILGLFSSVSNRPGIRDIKWLPDNRTLVFIGETSEKPIAQIYAIDIFSKKIDQLTNHPKAVFTYDMNDAGDIIFTAGKPVPDETFGKTRFVVGLMSMDRRQMKVCNKKDIYKNNEVPVLSQAFFLPGEGTTQTVQIGKPFHGFSYGNILSADGRWAIGTRLISGFPEKWMKDYFPIKNKEWLKYNIKNFDPNTMIDRQFYGTRFVLLDISNGTETPLFDAPTGYLFGGIKTDIKLIPDENSVILGNTFLPLDTSDPKEREHRRNSTFTVEYNIQTKRFKIIAEHAIRPGESWPEELYTGIELQSDGTLILSLTGDGKPLPPKIYQRQNSEWSEIENAGKSNDKNPGKFDKYNRLELSIKQGLNTAPEVLAKDKESGNERLLTDLNPSFREITFGEIDIFSWKDKNGDTIDAGLVYPPNFKDGKRYPLMIQTHGFNSNKFLIEGPYAGAYAAQAFAAKDIMVLQIPDLGGGPTIRTRLQTAIESVIDLLDERGIIDRNKIGLIGFSNTGHAVQHMITFSDYNFAAATIADAFSMSLMGYLGWFGYNMVEIERTANGAVPWGERLADWLNQDPSFHLDRVRTPLRLDEYTAMYVWWDVYAILRRLQKPVEWVVYPGGDHALVKPLQRYTAQQESVDWFTFWLKGEEDPDPKKTEQYERWRKLRKQHELDLKKPRPQLLNISTTPVDNSIPENK